jgi:alpha-glucosidase
VDEQERDPASTLHVYRNALRMRAALFADDSFAWLETDREDVVAFRHGTGVSVTVMGTEAFEPPSAWGTIVLRSREGRDGELGPDSTAWLEADTPS